MRSSSLNFINFNALAAPFPKAKANEETIDLGKMDLTSDKDIQAESNLIPLPVAAGDNGRP
ncbi:hypothetical protein [Rhizobium fabae]|uniref:Uncharacterized protein n=1 Tax=Rhizobium fabae TaxID=573179 RepID=A0A7W6BAU1_9HYPH|nr:hypothetical protein [Rhizobium fabae]MBB3918820.1 hypothetical protein [Rhizobium fabae]RUM07393.1 hypothetical protein EFB14_30005 [Rhizobium fabae]